MWKGESKSTQRAILDMKTFRMLVGLFDNAEACTIQLDNQKLCIIERRQGTSSISSY